MWKYKNLLYSALTGLLLSILSFFVANTLEQKRIQTIFEKYANDRIGLISNSIEMMDLVTESLRNIFIASDDISLEDFQNFIGSYRKRIYGIKAIEWIPRVTHDQKENFLDYARKSISNNYFIKEMDENGELIPVERKDEYFPVLYSEPQDNNRQLLGFDLSSNPERYNALQKSISSNNFIATEQINLVNEEEYGIILFDPVFKDQPETNNSVERKRKLVGFISSVFNPEEIVKNSINLLQTAGIDIYLVDESAPSENQLLYTSNKNFNNVTKGIDAIGSFKTFKKILIGGRTWSIICLSTENFISTQNSSIPNLVFLISISISSFFIYFYYRHLIEQEKTNGLVAERTKKLNDTNKRLDLAISGADLGVWDWQIETGDVYFNERWASMLGYKLDEIEPNVNSWSNLLHPDDSKVVNDVLKQHLENKIPIYLTEHRLLTKSGKWKWILDVGKVVERDNQGKALRAIGIHMDISERVDNQHKILEYNKKLESVNQDKDKLFSIIGHDLKSPLISIKGFAEFLANDIKDLSNDEIEQYAKYIYQSSNSLDSILESLLEWGSMQLGKTQFVPDYYDLEEIVNKVVNQYILIAHTKDILMQNTIDRKFIIYADKNMVESVLRNLISNALKFTPRNGEIFIYAQLYGEKSIKVSITDNGIGIDSKRLENLFNNSFHKSTIGTEGEKGTGLGVSLSRDFIEKNGGKIWAESNESMGTTFHFTLCLNEACFAPDALSV